MSFTTFPFDCRMTDRTIANQVTQLVSLFTMFAIKLTKWLDMVNVKGFAVLLWGFAATLAHFITPPGIGSLFSPIATVLFYNTALPAGVSGTASKLRLSFPCALLRTILVLKWSTIFPFHPGNRSTTDRAWGASFPSFLSGVSVSPPCRASRRTESGITVATVDGKQFVAPLTRLSHKLAIITVFASKLPNVIGPAMGAIFANPSFALVYVSTLFRAITSLCSRRVSLESLTALYTCANTRDGHCGNSIKQIKSPAILVSCGVAKLAHQTKESAGPINYCIEDTISRNKSSDANKFGPDIIAQMG